MLKQQKNIVEELFQNSINSVDIYNGSGYAMDFDKEMRHYLEQPQFLDEVIPDMLQKLFLLVKEDILNKSTTRPYIYSLIYTILDVRNFRFCLKYFENHVTLLQPLIEFIQFAQKAKFQIIDLKSFQSIDITILETHLLFRLQFVLLAHLSLLVLLPFNMTDFDGDIAHQIVDLAYFYKSMNNKLTQMANEALARFICRQDQKELQQEQISFINNQIDLQIKNPKKELTSYVQLLSFVSRFSQQKIQILKSTKNIRQLLESKNRELRKITSVLISRVAASFLQKSYRSKESQMQEIQSFDVPEEFDFYIDGLLLCLSDSDQFVRQTAAFGLGFVIQKLPILFVQELLEAVFDCCTEATDAETWNGALMCVGEVVRAGAIDFKQNKLTLKSILVSAFQNKFKQQNMVKDAACFLTWALARNYAPAELGREFIQEICNNLLALACLDRDICIRRCAAAAFQECAGRWRQQYIQNSIECAALVDFYKLGDLGESYFGVAVKICEFYEPYRALMIKYLVDQYLMSQQQLTRTQVSNLICKLFKVDDDWIIEEMLMNLEDVEDWVKFSAACELLASMNLNSLQKEKLVLTITQILKNFTPPSNADTQHQLTQNLCLVLISFFDEFDSLVVEQFANQIFNQSIRFYFQDLAIQNYERIFQNKLLLLKRKFLKQKEFNDDLLTAVSLSCLQEMDSMRCLEMMKRCRFAADNVTRVYIIHAIQVQIQRNSVNITQNQIEEVYQIINQGLNDFTSDTRGDVGALVRHKAFNCLKFILESQIVLGQLQQKFVILYKIATCQFSCSRVEQMKLLGIKSLFRDSQLFGLNVQAQKYTSIQQNFNKEMIFDMAELTNEELQQSIEKSDAALIKNGFQLFKDIFLNDQLLNKVCLKQLILNICYGQKDEIQETIQLVMGLQQKDFYDFVLKLMDKITNQGYVSQIQFSCILLTNYLIHKNYIPTEEQYYFLVEKIKQYISQEQINFNAFQTAFSVYGYIIQRFIPGQLIETCKKELLGFLTHRTVKLREQAFDIILALNLNNEHIEEMCQIDWMSLNVQVAEEKSELVKNMIQW